MDIERESAPDGEKIKSPFNPMQNVAHFPHERQYRAYFHLNNKSI